MLFEDGSLIGLGRDHYLERLANGYALVKIGNGSVEVIYRGPSLQDVLAEYRLIREGERND